MKDKIYDFFVFLVHYLYICEKTMRNIDSPMLDGTIRYYYGMIYKSSVVSVIHRDSRITSKIFNKNSTPKYKNYLNAEAMQIVWHGI